MIDAQRKILALAVIGVAAAAAILLLGFIRRAAPMPSDADRFAFATSYKSKNMRLESPDFIQGGAIPAIYSCEGENVNPPLRIRGVPENAKSLALIMEDPDAVGGTWTHWLVWNLPPDVLTIESGSLPSGARVGLNDAGQSGYFGPCPPSGKHRYFFKVYALDEVLLLPAGAARSELEVKLNDYTIDKAGLYGVYGR